VGSPPARCPSWSATSTPQNGGTDREHARSAREAGRARIGDWRGEGLVADGRRKEVGAIVARRGGKKTSAKVAKQASRALRDGRSSKRTKSIAASALAQA